MSSVADVFIPLSGHLVWGVRRVHGSIIDMNFGDPHLLVREPLKSIQSRSSVVRITLSRRRVFIVGQWQLSIQEANWEICSENDKIDNLEQGSETIERCLGEID